MFSLEGRTRGADCNSNSQKAQASRGKPAGVTGVTSLLGGHLIMKLSHLTIAAWRSSAASVGSDEPPRLCSFSSGSLAAAVCVVPPTSPEMSTAAWTRLVQWRPGP